MIRVVLPTQLCELAKVSREVELEVGGTACISTVLDALEIRHPMLRGTIRDQLTLQRRPFIRFFACGDDLSQDSPTEPLPEEVLTGREPLRVIGAMAGG
jgi:sulfur-carrier protein